MACPYVSGITYLIRSAHLNWSLVVIMSAIMTTTDVAYHYGKPIMGGNVPANYFSMGSGHMSHINPDKAVDPRLIYDIKPKSCICAVWDREKSKMFTIKWRNIRYDELFQKNKGFILNYFQFLQFLGAGKELRQFTGE